MSGEDLELQYASEQWAHRDPIQVIPLHCDITKKESLKVLDSLSCQLDVAYGPTERQKVDIITDPALPKDAPILVYIHGGYWAKMSRDHFWFIGQPIVKAGAMLVVIGYDLAPTVSLEEIIRQVRRGVQFVMDMAVERGSRGMYLCGHSAGGHLTAMMLCTDWAAIDKKYNDVIKGAVMCSGVYDLRRLVDTFVNDPLHLTKEGAWENSPTKHVAIAHKCCKKMDLLVVIAQYDSPEFHRLSQEFTEALRGGELKVSYLEVKEVDHFNLIENLSDPHYLLTQEIMKLMKL